MLSTNIKIADSETEVDSNTTCGVTYFHDAAATEERQAAGAEVACARQGRREANHSSTEFLRRRDNTY